MMDNLRNFSAAGLVYPAFARCLCQVFRLGPRSAFVRLLPASSSSPQAGQVGWTGWLLEVCACSHPQSPWTAPL